MVQLNDSHCGIEQVPFGFCSGSVRVLFGLSDPARNGKTLPEIDSQQSPMLGINPLHVHDQGIWKSAANLCNEQGCSH